MPNPINSVILYLKGETTLTARVVVKSEQFKGMKNWKIKDILNYIDLEEHQKKCTLIIAYGESRPLIIDTIPNLESEFMSVIRSHAIIEKHFSKGINMYLFDNEEDKKQFMEKGDIPLGRITTLADTSSVKAKPETELPSPGSEPKPVAEESAPSVAAEPTTSTAEEKEEKPIAETVKKTRRSLEDVFQEAEWKKLKENAPIVRYYDAQANELDQLTEIEHEEGMMREQTLYRSWPEGNKNDYTKGTDLWGATELIGGRPMQEDTVCVSRLLHSETLTTLAKEKLLKETCKHLQIRINEHKDNNVKWYNGSTSVLSIVDPSPASITDTERDDYYDYEITTASLGDSDAFLVILDKEGKVIKNPYAYMQYSEDANDAFVKGAPSVAKISPKHHKPDAGRLGGHGGLAINRAFGDNKFEKHGLSHDPDITSVRVKVPKGGSAILLSACDGFVEPMDRGQYQGDYCNQHEKYWNSVCEIIETHHDNPAVLSTLLAKNAVDKGHKKDRFTPKGDNVSVVVNLMREKTLLSEEEQQAVHVQAVNDGHGTGTVHNATSQFLRVEMPGELEEEYKHAIAAGPSYATGSEIKWTTKISPAQKKHNKRLALWTHAREGKFEVSNQHKVDFKINDIKAIGDNSINEAIKSAIFHFVEEFEGKEGDLERQKTLVETFCANSIIAPATYERKTLPTPVATQKSKKPTGISRHFAKVFSLFKHEPEVEVTTEVNEYDVLKAEITVTSLVHLSKELDELRRLINAELDNESAPHQLKGPFGK